MGFRNDFDNANMENFNNKPEGPYEVLIVSIEEKKFKTGTIGLNVKMVIRNDVEQPCKNGFLFHTFWKRRSPNEMDKQVKGYSFNQLMCLAQAAKLPNGKEYETLDELCNDMIGKPIVASMEYQGEYNGKPQERIVEFDPTTHAKVKHTEKKQSEPDSFAQAPESGFTVSSGSMLDDEDDLPFL